MKRENINVQEEKKKLKKIMIETKNLKVYRKAFSDLLDLSFFKTKSSS